MNGSRGGKKSLKPMHSKEEILLNTYLLDQITTPTRLNVELSIKHIIVLKTLLLF